MGWVLSCRMSFLHGGWLPWLLNALVNSESYPNTVNSLFSVVFQIFPKQGFRNPIHFHIEASICIYLGLGTQRMTLLNKLFLSVHLMSIGRP